MFLRKTNCCHCQYHLIFKRYINAETSFNKNFAKKKSSESHIFKKTLFSNHKELASYFSNNLVYNNNGLIVLNKPYGLKKAALNVSKNEFQPALHPSVSHLNHLSFDETLPYLSKLLNISTLEPIKFPERYISGLSFLSSNERITHTIKKCLTPLEEPYTYLAICVGIPKEKENFLKLGLTFVTKDQEKRVVLVDKYSKRALERKLVIPFVVHHRTLSVNEDLKISLIQLKVNRNRWNSLRLFCATRLFTPCLGDWLMASRVKYINNIPVVVDPLSAMANFTEKLPSNILDALMIGNNDQNGIPLHMHLVQVDLKRYKLDPTTFIGKPPEHFLWSCEQLGISVPDYFLQNCSLPFTEAFTTAFF